MPEYKKCPECGKRKFYVAATAAGPDMLYSIMWRCENCNVHIREEIPIISKFDFYNAKGYDFTLYDEIRNLLLENNILK